MAEREMQINITCQLITSVLKENNLTLTVDKVKGIYAPILIDNSTNKRYVFVVNDKNKGSER